MIATVWLESAGYLGVLGLLVSAASVFYLRRQTRDGEHDDARSEALDLAEVRGQRISDLTERVAKLEAALKLEQRECAAKLEDLRATMEHTRQVADENQRLLTVGIRAVLVRILGHLEAHPPDVEAAIAYLRTSLVGDIPAAS